ncbi:hypothetical protein ACHAXS_010160 [Conticribra weissflogii]
MSFNRLHRMLVIRALYCLTVAAKATSLENQNTNIFNEINDGEFIGKTPIILQRGSMLRPRRGSRKKRIYMTGQNSVVNSFKSNMTTHGKSNTLMQSTNIEKPPGSSLSDESVSVHDRSLLSELSSSDFPTAVDDEILITSSDTDQILPVLENDISSDPMLSVVFVNSVLQQSSNSGVFQTASGGSVKISPDGTSLLYTPNEELTENVDETFGYIMCDSRGFPYCSSAFVTIKIVNQTATKNNAETPEEMDPSIETTITTFNLGNDHVGNDKLETRTYNPTTTPTYSPTSSSRLLDLTVKVCFPQSFCDPIRNDLVDSVELFEESFLSSVLSTVCVSSCNVSDASFDAKSVCQSHIEQTDEDCIKFDLIMPAESEMKANMLLGMVKQSIGSSSQQLEQEIRQKSKKINPTLSSISISTFLVTHYSITAAPHVATPMPTRQPTKSPTPMPTSKPSTVPTLNPTPAPSLAPMPEPTVPSESQQSAGSRFMLEQDFKVCFPDSFCPTIINNMITAADLFEDAFNSVVLSNVCITVCDGSNSAYKAISSCQSHDTLTSTSCMEFGVTLPVKSVTDAYIALGMLQYSINVSSPQLQLSIQDRAHEIMPSLSSIIVTSFAATGNSVSTSTLAPTRMPTTSPTSKSTFLATSATLPLSPEGIPAMQDFKVCFPDIYCPAIKGNVDTTTKFIEDAFKSVVLSEVCVDMMCATTDEVFEVTSVCQSSEPVPGTNCIEMGLTLRAKSETEADIILGRLENSIGASMPQLQRSIQRHASTVASPLSSMPLTSFYVSDDDSDLSGINVDMDKISVSPDSSISHSQAAYFSSESIDNDNSTPRENSPTVSKPNEEFYPIWDNINICVNDDNPPYYIKSNPSMYIFASIEECCTAFFPWSYDECIHPKPEPCTSNAMESGEKDSENLFYPDW